VVHSELHQLQKKNPTLCRFVDETCPGIDDANYVNLLKRANLAMYYTTALA